MTEALTLPEALDMIEFLKAQMAEMVGAYQSNLPGFTKNESRILRCLMSANGRAISRHGLMRAVYFDRDKMEPNISIIDVYATKIRAKLRLMGKPICFLTEWGVGFYWSGPSLEPEAAE